MKILLLGTHSYSYSFKLIRVEKVIVSHLVEKFLTSAHLILPYFMAQKLQFTAIPTAYDLMKGKEVVTNISEELAPPAFSEKN